VIDASRLPATSTKKPLPWRETRVAILRVAANGQIDQANTLQQKRALVASCAPEDCLLAVRMLQFPNRPEVLVVDDLEPVRAALG
jgi:hypothetical protein